MKKYCYSKDVIFTQDKLLKEMDLSIFLSNRINQRDCSMIKSLLENFSIYTSPIDYENMQITVRVSPMETKSSIYEHIFPLANISNRYYDEQDKLSSEFSVMLGNGTLLSLEGEIYEQLHLDSNNIEVFKAQHQYDDHICPELVSCIHFKGIEYNRYKKSDYDETLKNLENKNLTDRERQILQQTHEKTKEIKEMYITKDRQKFQMYYNGPHIFNNLGSTGSLSVEEIDIIQSRILELILLNGKCSHEINFYEVDQHTNDNEQFLEYVYAYLSLYKKIVANKGYQEKSVDMIDAASIQMIIDCINGKYPTGVFCKITMISDNPIETTEEKNRQFLKNRNVQ